MSRLIFEHRRRVTPPETRKGTITIEPPPELPRLVPPSLRFGLFDVVRRIGGPDAEKLLGEMLGTTGRGVELAWLARAFPGLGRMGYDYVARNRRLISRLFPLWRASRGRAD